MKIRITVQTNKVGSECDDEIELEDHLTEEDIEAIAKDVMFEMIEWNWKRI